MRTRRILVTSLLCILTLTFNSLASETPMPTSQELIQIPLQHDDNVPAGKASPATFWAASRITSNALLKDEHIAVLGHTSCSTSAFVHRMVIDQEQYEVDSIVFNQAWNTAFHFWRADTLEISAQGPAGPMIQGDTLYTIWFRQQCAALFKDGLRIGFIDGQCTWTPLNCSDPWSQRVSYVSGTVQFADSAAIEVYAENGPPVLWNEPRVISYRIRARHTFDVPYIDNGWSFVFTWRRENDAIDKRNASFLQIGYPVIPLDGTPRWYRWTDTGKDTAGIFQGRGGAHIYSASNTMKDLLQFPLDWYPGEYDSVVWGHDWVVPKLVHYSSIFGHYTRIPVQKCPEMYCDAPTGALRYGKFNDSIMVMMSQIATDEVDSPTSCVWQQVRVRSNFTMDSCASIRIRCPSGAKIVAWTNPYDLAIKRVDARTVTASGKLSKTVTASDNFTDLLAVQVQSLSDPCASDVSLKVDGAIFHDMQGHEGFEAIPSLSKARTSCQVACRDIIDPNGLGGVAKPTLPTEFSVSQNYPNPFNPVTAISLSLPKATDWTITIFNATGQAVKEFSGSSGPGTISVTWDAGSYASGVYFYRAEASEFEETRKMLLLK